MGVCGRGIQFIKDGFAQDTLFWSRLSPTVKRKHLATFYYCCFMTICCYVFINSAQAYILEKKLELEDLGKATGDLGFYSELLIMATAGLWGMASDKIGRKPVYFAAFFFMSLGLYLYSFATEFWILIMYRLIFALGASAAAAMLTSVLADYVVTEDKGTASGFMGLFTGCGALFAAIILLQMPSWFTDSLGEDQAVTLMFMFSASLALFSGIVAVFGLQSGRPKLDNPKEHLGFKILIEGFRAGANDCRLAIAYAAGFVARGDAVIITTFLSLWIQDYVINELGGSEEEALSKAGSITGISQTFALIFAVPAGIMSSKLDSVLALVISSLIAFVGYGGIAFTTNPTGGYGILCACIIGCGEISVIVSAQALASRQAPAHLRGTVGGTVGFCGSVGILVCTKLGGYLYDEWRAAGPFVLFASFNGVIVIWGFIYWLLSKRIQKEEQYPPLLSKDKDDEEKALYRSNDSVEGNDDSTEGNENEKINTESGVLKEF